MGCGLLCQWCPRDMVTIVLVCPTSKDSARWCNNVNTSSQRPMFFICDSSQVCVSCL